MNTLKYFKILKTIFRLKHLKCYGLIWYITRHIYQRLYVQLIKKLFLKSIIECYIINITKKLKIKKKRNVFLVQPIHFV